MEGSGRPEGEPPRSEISKLIKASLEELGGEYKTRGDVQSRLEELSYNYMIRILLGAEGLADFEMSDNIGRNHVGLAVRGMEVNQNLVEGRWDGVYLRISGGYEWGGMGDSWLET